MVEKYKKSLVAGGLVLLLVVVFVGVSIMLRSGSISRMGVNTPLDESGISLQNTVEEKSALFPDSLDGGFAGEGMDVMMPVSEQESISVEQKIVREANLSIRVENAEKAVEQFRGVAEWHKGNIFSINIRENGQGVRSGSVVIKVPTESFDAAIAGIKEGATVVVQESISNQDVTAEFVDMEARLKNKKAEEEAFIKILEKAEKTTDIISVTRELSRVRGEIEVMEGQIRYMESKTQMATITIQLSEDQSVSFVETWRPWQEVKDAANDLLKSLQGFVSFVIRVFVWLLPLVLVYGLLAFGVWFVVRSVYRKFYRKSEKK